MPRFGSGKIPRTGRTEQGGDKPTKRTTVSNVDSDSAQDTMQHANPHAGKMVHTVGGDMSGCCD